MRLSIYLNENYMTKEPFFLLKGTFGRGQLSPELTPSMAFTNEHDDLFFLFLEDRNLTDLLAIITPNCQNSILDSSNPAQKLWMRLHRIDH